MRILIFLFMILFVSCNDNATGEFVSYEENKAIISPTPPVHLIQAYDGDSCEVMRIECDSTVIFYSKGKEMLKVTPEGKFYVAGRYTAKNMRVYLKFKEWIEEIWSMEFEEVK